MSVRLNRDQVIDRLSRQNRPLASHGRQFTAPGLDDVGEVHRGDHDLNPDMRPAGPLREAAVLVGLIAPENPGEDYGVLLTQRSVKLKSHGGQVAFPGGRVDPTDKDAIDAALREAEEEVALPRHRAEVVGFLDTYVTRTGFRITPVVAFLEGPLDLKPEPTEVDSIFDVPLSFVLDRDNHRRHSRTYQGRERQFYVFPHPEYYIWGATAGMLVNLAEVLGIPQDD